MSEKTKKTVSISFDQLQIEKLDAMASNYRRQTGHNMTRSEVVRQLVEKALGQQQASITQPSSPASTPTPSGGRTVERSEGGTGGIQQGQEG